jgi:hypothetical protein
MGGCLEFRPPESGFAGLRRASAALFDRLRNGAVKSPARERSPQSLTFPTFARTQTHELQSLEVAIALRRDDARVCRLHGPRPLRLRHLPGLLCSATGIRSASRRSDHDGPRPELPVAATWPGLRPDAGLDAFAVLIAAVVAHARAVADAFVLVAAG